MLQELLTDEREEYVEEPRGLDEVLPALFRYRRPSGKLLADAYLAAFAECSGLGLVTFDAGFREYPGTEVQLLRHAGKMR
jgi:predicted nucleic acid-binding protein